MRKGCCLSTNELQCSLIASCGEDGNIASERSMWLSSSFCQGLLLVKPLFSCKGLLA